MSFASALPGRPARPPKTGSGGERLKKTSEYRMVYAKGRRLRGEFFWAYILPTGPLPARIGISISRSIVKSAVVRNRIKRVIRSWFSQNRGPLFTRGCDAVIVVKKPLGLSKTDSARARRDLAGLFTKAARQL